MRDEKARSSGLRTTASLVVVVQLPLLDCFRHLLRPINIVDLGELQQPMAGSSSHLGDLSGYFIANVTCSRFQPPSHRWSTAEVLTADTSHA